MAIQSIASQVDLNIAKSPEIIEEELSKEIPSGASKASTSSAWTLAKVALIATAVLGIGAAAYYTSIQKPTWTFPTSFEQLANQRIRVDGKTNRLVDQHDRVIKHSAIIQIGNNLRDSCNTVLNNFCPKSKDGTELCLRGLFDSNDKFRVDIVNDDMIVCRGTLKQGLADNVLPAIREHFNNFGDVIVGKLPDTFSDILSDHFTIDDPRKAFQTHQAKYKISEDQVAFTTRFSLAQPAKVCALNDGKDLLRQCAFNRTIDSETMS